MNFDTYRPLIAKFLAPFVGVFVTFLKKKYHVEFDANDSLAILNSLTDLLVFAISTGLTAVLINKKVNPGNAASSHLAGAEARESKIIKDTVESPVYVAKSYNRED